ncbi:uncharacterized protein LOC119190702 [Manduca sexta]|uniref:uncharacterized protein LOC119190702 n=1 Tax=Manduca sexta TaxID=7130 RepID=UPI00188E2F2B|nr:uncharacterized protein LOC119190702 [Manduca sexta]
MYQGVQRCAPGEGGSFQCLVDGAELARHVGEGLSIFTDRSKIEGKVGAALSIWNGAAETSTRKLRLEPYCSVYQAELLALRKAVEEALRSGLPACGIFSNARSALDVVARGDSLHPIAFEIKKLIKEAKKRTQKIELFWVKAHVGLEGNERADVLANDAAQHLKTRAHYDKCPVSFVKRQIRKDSIEPEIRGRRDGFGDEAVLSGRGRGAQGRKADRPGRHTDAGVHGARRALRVLASVQVQGEPGVPM